MNGFVGLLLVVLAAETASPYLCEGILEQLPDAFARYHRQLYESGRGTELEKPSDAWFHDFEQGMGGLGPTDSTWNEAPAPFDTLAPGTLALYMTSFPVDHGLTGRWIVDSTQVAGEDRPCREHFYSRFHLAEGKVCFTAGHFVEGCTDVPWMIWTAGKEWFRYPLPDLFGMNVEGLWCTEDYLVLRLRVEYEYGSRQEGWAFWNLEGAWISAIAAETDVGVAMDKNDPVRENATTGLGLYLRDQDDAGVQQVKDTIRVRNGDFELVFRPETREWTRLLPRD